jgi:uracil-DNA glycosylase
MLEEAGLRRADCYLTNVFNRRPSPASNDLEHLCGGKAEGIRGYPALLPRGAARYVRQEFIPELERLGDEIATQDPNVIVAFGNTPTWCLLGRTGISKLRGTTNLSTHCATGFKVLPTYHPAAIMRQWELRAVSVLDLQKAKRESEFPEIRRPQRLIHIPETPEEVDEWFKANLSRNVSVDIETSGSRVTCIGFATSSSTALVVPFVEQGRKGRNFWPTRNDELSVWKIIRHVLGDRSYQKLFQNGLYDISFLYRSYGIKVFGTEHDTMLLHHALQPEAPKALGFLGSVYCDEGPWKEMRKSQTIKRDE